MKRFTVLAAAACLLAPCVVALAPQSADAGWRGKAWRTGYAPGYFLYRDSRWGHYPPRQTCRRNCGHYPYAYYPYWRKRYFRGWY